MFFFSFSFFIKSKFQATFSIGDEFQTSDGRERFWTHVVDASSFRAAERATSLTVSCSADAPPPPDVLCFPGSFSFYDDRLSEDFEINAGVEEVCFSF